jgi:hypothetical protein
MNPFLFSFSDTIHTFVHCAKYAGKIAITSRKFIPPQKNQLITRQL